MAKITIDPSTIFNVLIVDPLITNMAVLTNGPLITHMVLFTVDPLITQDKPYGFIYR